jgi:hypothetical protein
MTVLSRNVALKKLTASDLSFFASYFARFPNVKQKALNLDAAVIERTFFPNMAAAIAAAPGQRAPTALTIYGPGGAGIDLLMRKVLKQQKNWRLNGELIHNPPSQPHRYDNLVPGDLAIMEFYGSAMPNAIKIVFLQASDPADATTHAELTRRYPGSGMVVLSEDDISAAITAANTPTVHPIRDWLEGDLLEAIGNGDAQAVERLTTRRAGRGLTADDLDRARETATKVGRDGEELLNFYFQEQEPANVADYDWVSSTNAVSPYDFSLGMTDGSVRHLDAKSTGGAFGNSIYMSIGEIREAVSGGVPYDLYRLYNVTESSASMRIAHDVGPLLAPVLANVAALPAGVKVESLAFDPTFFNFGAQEIGISYPDEP